MALKKLMREQGRTYAQAAEVLGLSEGSVKRLFSTSGLTLNRLDQLCEWLGFDIKDVVLESERQTPLLTALTLEQEKELSQDLSLLLVTYLVLNQWKESEIKEIFNFSEAQLTRHFIKLEKIGMIELLPFNRIRLLTARNFSWSPNGPVQKFFTNTILKEFLGTSFRKPGEKSNFAGGMLSKNSILKLHEKMEELMRTFDSLISDDLRLPADDRFAVSLFLGFRPWEFSEFTKLRRNKQHDPFSNL